MSSVRTGNHALCRSKKPLIETVGADISREPTYTFFTNLCFQPPHFQCVSGPRFRGHQLDIPLPLHERRYLIVSNQRYRELRLLSASNPDCRVRRLLVANCYYHRLFASQHFLFRSPFSSQRFPLSSQHSPSSSQRCRHLRGRERDQVQRPL